MAIQVPTNLDYLIDQLRFELGDIDPTAYRYLDEWLRTSLVVAVKGLQRWWNFKYLINDSTNNAYRNPHKEYLFPEPPIISHDDERPIILYATVLVKSGNMENVSWTVGSWRDAEIAYSNIESGKMKEASLKRAIDGLHEILNPPSKRLGWPVKRSLPGYKDNRYETD